MPVVPTLNGPSVAAAPLPDARLSPNAPLEAFGGGNAAPPDVLGGLTHVASAIYDDERRKANEVAITTADAQLAKAHTEILYGTQGNPGSGLLNKRGSDAFTAPEDLQAAWEKASGDVLGGLTNDDQKAAVTRMANGRYGQMDMQVQQHVATQRDKYDEDNTNGLVSAEADLALQNYEHPDLIAGSVARQQEALTAYASRHPGLPEGWLKQQLAQTTSKTYSNVIERMVDNGDDLGASAYYAQVQQYLTGTDQATLTKPLEIGSVRGESQRQGDSIMQSATTLTEGLRQAAQITDPRVREETEQRVRQGFADQASSMRQQRQEAYQQAGQILEKAGDMDRIPASLLAQVSVEDRRELFRREKELRNPVKASNVDVYTSLMNKATLNSATQAEFLSTDLSKYRSQLSESDYRRLWNKKISLQQHTTERVRSDSTRLARQQAKEAQHKLDRQDLLSGKMPTLNIPGGPMAPTAAAPVPSPTPHQQPGGTVAPTHGSGLPIPKEWIERAKNPRYRQYLKDHGYAVP